MEIISLDKTKEQRSPERRHLKPLSIHHHGNQEKPREIHSNCPFQKKQDLLLQQNTIQ